MKKKVMSFVAAAALVLSCLVLSIQPALAADYIAAEHTASNGRPYYIMVNRTTNTVTVYGLDAAGYYTAPVKAMVCSVGRSGSPTPTGNFSVTGYKRAWLRMVDGSDGQYATQFYGNYLFHSVCYSRSDPSALKTESYNMLGGPASLGCVRLQTADAKWIYDNCAAGTRVTIYDGNDPGPLGKPDTVVSQITPELDNGWDPTDPRANNPWRQVLVSDVRLNKTEDTLAVGETDVLTATRLPSTATMPSAVAWSSSDPSVATVDDTGNVIALGEGTAVITAACGTGSAACTVTVSGQPLPFDDVVPGAWYYSDVRYAYESGLFAGTGEDTFSPGKPATYAMVLQVLYRMSGADQDGEPGQEGDAWYSAAFRWAAGNGLADGMTESGCDSNGQLSRQELAALLYRYETMLCARPAGGFASLSDFSDSRDIYLLARDAVSWAVGNGLLQGTSEDTIQPTERADRAQVAAVIHRYSSMQAQQ